MSDGPVRITELAADDQPPQGRPCIVITLDAGGHPASAEVSFSGRSTVTSLKHMDRGEAERWAADWAGSFDGDVYVRRQD